MTKLLLAMALLAGCATPTAMTTGPTVIGAEGEVKVAEGPNHNTKVMVQIRHLAEPAKVAEGATVYIVWIQPSDGVPQNSGQVMLDKDRMGTIETLTPFKTFKVTVTAEPNAAATAPSSNPVLSTEIHAHD